MSEYNLNYLDFEQPLLEIENKIASIKTSASTSQGDRNKIDSLNKELEKNITKIFSSLSDWQISQLARHPLRPYTLDYVSNIFDDFVEIHGDRMFGDDKAIICGLAKLDGRSIILIGHQKGRDSKDKVFRNFGMPKPEGYRKALRAMKLAEKFKIPIVTFIDTPGAYPGIDAEERGQSEAIAKNLALMARLKTPIVTSVIGEGGSGGALAIGVCDKLLMLEFSTYSVISPEGCASILWKSAAHAPEAAEAMGITADRLFSLGLVDQLVREPLGGAHRAPEQAATALGDAIEAQLDILGGLSEEQLLESRYQKLMQFGVGRS